MWTTREAKKSTKKIKKQIFAMPAAAMAIPVNPNSAASKAITRKVRAQFNILYSFRHRSGFHLCVIVQVGNQASEVLLINIFPGGRSLKILLTAKRQYGSLIHSQAASATNAPRSGKGACFSIRDRIARRARRSLFRIAVSVTPWLRAISSVV